MITHAKPIVSGEDFTQFRQYFYEKTGILFDNSKRYFVDKRLIERMQATGAATFKDYFHSLSRDRAAAELQVVTNLMTVNETYFFREEYQFKCLVGSVLRDVCSRKTNSDPIRIWSIPSSSGEEPYSIALYLMHFWPGIAQWDVEIISSDINTKILNSARQGLYSARSVQHLPRYILDAHFTRKGEEFQISDELRQSVEFTKVNIASPLETVGYKNFDIIFCRNLLIYFDDLSRRTAAETMYDALNDNGYVFLGHSESMSRITPLFRARHFSEAIAYQKKAD